MTGRVMLEPCFDEDLMIRLWCGRCDCSELIMVSKATAALSYADLTLEQLAFKRAEWHGWQIEPPMCRKCQAAA